MAYLNRLYGLVLETEKKIKVSYENSYVSYNDRQRSRTVLYTQISLDT